jgi:hypothetical protein
VGAFSRVGAWVIVVCDPVWSCTQVSFEPFKVDGAQTERLYVFKFIVFSGMGVGLNRVAIHFSPTVH